MDMMKMRSLRRTFYVLAALIVTGVAVYVGGYYYVTAEWPWQTDENAADLVLQEAANAPAYRPGAQAIHPLAQHAQKTPQARQPIPSNGTEQPTAAPVPSTTGQVGVQHGTIEQGIIHSHFMNDDLPCLIYLPPGYNDPANTNRRYPVVYLLHGAPGNYKDWAGGGNAAATADTLISTGRIPPMILVMPEGKTNLTVDSEWANGAPPAPQAESYVVQEVVPYIDAHYRTIADQAHRAIGGLSSGGYGGVNTTLHHPDIFGTAFGLSGNYLATRTILRQPLFRDSASIAYNSPIVAIAQMKTAPQIHVYLAVGKQDKLDNTLAETQQMEQALIKANVPHEVQYFPGAHSWHFWSLHLVDALEYFAGTLPEG